MRFSSTILAGFIIFVGAAGCSDPVGPPGNSVEESDLIFVRTVENAPELDATVVSFWAVPDESRSVAIRYSGAGPYPAGDCLTFTVPAGAITGQDSVLITIEVVDTDRFDFEFAPAGLRFAEGHPARLEVNYLWADRDFDGDGDVDADDDEIADSFGFWRQEQTGAPWFEVATVKGAEDPRAVAVITGFTRYALASN